MNNQNPTSPKYLKMQPSYPYYAHPSNSCYYPIWPNMNVMPPNINYNMMPGNNMMPNFQMTPQNYQNYPHNYMPYPSNGMMPKPNHQQGAMMPYQPRNTTAQGAISPTTPPMNNYPNAPMMPKYQTRLPSPNSPNTLMPRILGFIDGLMPNGSVILTNSSVYRMPNQKCGMMSSRSNNATNQLNDKKDNTCLEVWSQNQEEMLDRVKELAKTYKVIALDTEFPGDPLGSNDNWRNASTQEAYDFVKKNADCSKMISLG